MKKSVLLFLLALLLAALPRAYASEPGANASEPRECRDRTAMIDALIDEYDEQLVEVHEVMGQGLLEFHVSPDEGTWTAVLTNGSGVSCVIAFGEGIDPAKTLPLKVDLSI